MQKVSFYILYVLVCVYGKVSLYILYVLICVYGKVSLYILYVLICVYGKVSLYILYVLIYVYGKVCVICRLVCLCRHPHINVLGSKDLQMYMDRLITVVLFSEHKSSVNLIMLNNVMPLYCS